MIPQELRNRAGNLRINVSAVCRLALADEVSKVEKKRGIAAKAYFSNLLFPLDTYGISIHKLPNYLSV
jgi:hypothetical protein